MTEAAGQQKDQQAVITTDSPTGIKIEYPQRKTKAFQVFEHEFESLTSIGNSLDLTLGGVSFGAALSLGTTVATVTFETPMMRASFLAVLLVSIVFTAFFSVRSILGVIRTRREIKRIKTESPPVAQ